ncbi:MAG: hypothetical protein N2V75_08460 [Methanophagales archaeon]|nr:hypothetical protein [Methanophagales archaeon]
MCKTPIKKGDILKIYTDGAARSNPGPGACAFIFVKGDEVIVIPKSLCNNCMEAHHTFLDAPPGAILRIANT